MASTREETLARIAAGTYGQSPEPRSEERAVPMDIDNDNDDNTVKNNDKNNDNDNVLGLDDDDDNTVTFCVTETDNMFTITPSMVSGISPYLEACLKPSNLGDQTTVDIPSSGAKSCLPPGISVQDAKESEATALKFITDYLNFYQTQRVMFVPRRPLNCGAEGTIGDKINQVFGEDANGKDTPEMVFLRDFCHRISEMTLVHYSAIGIANFFAIDTLVNILCSLVAMKIQGLPVDEIKKQLDPSLLRSTDEEDEDDDEEMGDAF